MYKLIQYFNNFSLSYFALNKYDGKGDNLILLQKGIVA